MKALLLNSTYQPISFVDSRKAINLIVKGKVEVISSWKKKYVYSARDKIEIPAVIRLKYYVRWIPRKSRFNRNGLFRRDGYTCQYCGRKFKLSDLTIDHILPSSRGGKTTWMNCVASCFSCNNKKSNKTPDEAHMKLLSLPKIPTLSIKNEAELIDPIHNDWDQYMW